MQLAAALVQGGIHDFAAAAADVAGQVAQVLPGCVHDHVHDRLQEHQAGLGLGVAEAFHGGQLERVLRAVHLVRLAVQERGLDVDRGEAVLGPLGAGHPEAGLHRRDVLARNGAAEDLVDEVDVVGVRLVALLFLVRGPFLDALA